MAARDHDHRRTRRREGDGRGDRVRRVADDHGAGRVEQIAGDGGDDAGGRLAGYEPDGQSDRARRIEDGNVGATGARQADEMRRPGAPQTVDDDVGDGVRLTRPATAGRPWRSPRGEALEDGPHALERRAQVGLGVGVGEPQIPLAVHAERGAREHRHASLGQQPLGDLGRGPADALDVGERVEGAARRVQLTPGSGSDPSTIRSRRRRNSATMRCDRRLVALERRDAGELDERGRARGGVDHEPRDVLGQRRRHDAEAQAPARHRVALREAVEEDRGSRTPGRPYIETNSPS